MSGSPAGEPSRTHWAASSPHLHRPSPTMPPCRPSAVRAPPPAPLPSPPIGTAPDARQPRQPSSSRRPQERDGQGPSRPWFAGDDPSRPTDHLPRPGPDRRRLTGLPLPNHRDPLTGGTPTSPATDPPTYPGNDPGNSGRCRPAQQRRADPDRPARRAQAPSPRGGRRLEAGAGGRPRGEPRTSPPAATPHHRTAELTRAQHIGSRPPGPGKLRGRPQDQATIPCHARRFPGPPGLLTDASASGLLAQTPDLIFRTPDKQAKSRKHPSRPIRPGRPERREFEYVRHGTVSLLAAMDVTAGTIHPKIIVRNDSDTFIEFLTELDQALNPAKKIHLILDNGSSHTSTATRTWLADHPRFTVPYTPQHASWLHIVEIFFSILTRRMLRRGEFTSRQDLADKILKYIEVYNRTAKPFRWSYDAKLLKAA